jgi:GNAT superfamily N-acetyltransferase
MTTTCEPKSVTLSDGRQIVIHEAWRGDPAELGLGAYHEGELVGMVVCDGYEPPTGHIVIVVKPEWRGLGVGGSLLQRMVERSQDLGFRVLTLSHTERNEAARALLATSDFVAARRLRDGLVKVALFVPAPASNAVPEPLAA